MKGSVIDPGGKRKNPRNLIAMIITYQKLKIKKNFLAQW